MSKKVILTINTPLLETALGKPELQRRGFNTQSEYISHLIREDIKQYGKLGSFQPADVVGTQPQPTASPSNG